MNLLLALAGLAIAAAALWTVWPAMVDYWRDLRSRRVVADPEWERLKAEAMAELDVIDGTAEPAQLVRAPLQPGEVDMGPKLQPYAYHRVAPLAGCAGADCDGEHVMNMAGDVVACLRDDPTPEQWVARWGNFVEYGTSPRRHGGRSARSSTPCSARRSTEASA